MPRDHIPILVDEICDVIPPHAHYIIDGTAGHGGHIQAMCTTCAKRDQKVQLLAIDKDPSMITRLTKHLLPTHPQVTLQQGTYDHIGDYLHQHQRPGADFMLLDIGINREHVADADRGFSIKQSGPLDMRFDPQQGIAAREYLQQVPLPTFQKQLIDYGDFRPHHAAQLAREILREKKELHTTADLTQLLHSLGHNDRRCAVIFQVIRIVVNNELGHLERFLQNYHQRLRPGGKCAIITFHSIEDRMVKQAFKKQEDENLVKRVNKKVIKPSRKEQQHNKASKSAKLRIIQRGAMPTKKNRNNESY